MPEKNLCRVPVGISFIKSGSTDITYLKCANHRFGFSPHGGGSTTFEIKEILLAKERCFYYVFGKTRD